LIHAVASNLLSAQYWRFGGHFIAITAEQKKNKNKEAIAQLKKRKQA